MLNEVSVLAEVVCLYQLPIFKPSHFHIQTKKIFDHMHIYENFSFDVCTIPTIYDRLWENRTHSSNNQTRNICRQHKIMDFLFINTRVSLDIALSLHEVSTHLTSQASTLKTSTFQSYT